MKHEWVCIKKPFPDKIKYGHMSEEVHITRPGMFHCTKCGVYQAANFPPPEDWKHCGIIPDCETEVVRMVTEE